MQLRPRIAIPSLIRKQLPDLASALNLVRQLGDIGLMKCFKLGANGVEFLCHTELMACNVRYTIATRTVASIHHTVQGSDLATAECEQKASKAAKKKARYA